MAKVIYMTRDGRATISVDVPLFTKTREDVIAPIPLKDIPDDMPPAAVPIIPAHVGGV